MTSEGMKLIPLNTKFKYYCSEDGRIFREQTELKGWKHESFKPSKGKTGKYYLRFGLWMASGKRKFFFAQRLVGICYHSLLDNPKQIMRHLTDDTFNNHRDFVLPGTHQENQTIDRIEQGTYMNRGGGDFTMMIRFRFELITFSPTPPDIRNCF